MALPQVSRTGPTSCWSTWGWNGKWPPFVPKPSCTKNNAVSFFLQKRHLQAGFGGERGVQQKMTCVYMYIDVCTYQNWPTASYFWRSSFLKVSFLQGWFTSKVLDALNFLCNWQKMVHSNLTQHIRVSTVPWWISVPRYRGGGTSSNVRRPPPHTRWWQPCLVKPWNSQQ